MNNSKNKNAHFGNIQIEISQLDHVQIEHFQIDNFEMDKFENLGNGGGQTNCKLNFCGVKQGFIDSLKQKTENQHLGISIRSLRSG